MDYTREHVTFILNNWIKNEKLCVEKTGHSLSSIKLMLQNIGASYGFLNFGTGNPMCTLFNLNTREIHTCSISFLVGNYEFRSLHTVITNTVNEIVKNYLNPIITVLRMDNTR